VDDKTASDTTFQDTELLADYACILRSTVGYTAFVDHAMGT
jgi:hypothetical protein